MLTEPLPIELFVITRFSDKSVTSITENWRVESVQLQKIIVNYFKEMGIFSVLPPMEAELKETIIYWLKNSPEIFQLVRKADLQEQLRRQSRRAD